MGTGWHPKPTPSSPGKWLTDATRRPKAKCSWVMSIWLYGSRGDTSNLDHGQERLKKVRMMLEFRLQENL